MNLTRAFTQNGERYHALDGYSRSMFANIQYVKSLAQICTDESIAVFSANPGSQCHDLLSLLFPPRSSKLFKSRPSEVQVENNTATDTKHNIQTYVSPEEVGSWLQRKKNGMLEPSS